MASTIAESSASKNEEFLKEFAEGLEPEKKAVVQALYHNQTERDLLDEAYHKERVALEAKYRKLSVPLYKVRKQIVAGKQVVEHKVSAGETLESIASKYSVSVDDIKQYNTLEDAAPAPGTSLAILTGDPAGLGLPGFWVKALSTHPTIGEGLTEKDVRVLQLLEDIEEEDVEGGGFKLRFVFKQPNSFFSEPVLEKTIWVIESRSGEVEVVRDQGCKISWSSPSVNPTIKVMKKKAKPGQRDSKPAVKVEQVESFFRLFNTKVEKEIKGEEDLTQESAAGMRVLEDDYVLLSTIREELVPEAAKWYTGQALLEYRDMYDEDEDEGDEDEDDEDEDDNDVPAAAAAGKPGQDGAGDKAANPECKQQ